MRKIAVITVGRSDYGIYRPVLDAIAAHPDLGLQLIVGGMHLSREFGLTVREIERDGYPIAERVEMLLSSDTPSALAASVGLGTTLFANAYDRLGPDLLVVLGDRFEMFAAAIAALPFGIPIAHLHGGESTEGLIDEAVRHSITKMSHLHFVSTPAYRDRVVQLGEAPWRVCVSGAPGLDNIRRFPSLSRNEVENILGFPLSVSALLTTFHPVTLEYRDTDAHLDALLAALAESGHQVVFTSSNADTMGRHVNERIGRFVAEHADAHLVGNLGTEHYFNLMRHAGAMVGNSSSGIIEAASFALPVVNIGDRQRGRIHGANVVDVPCSRPEILDATRRVITPAFRESIAGIENPYGDGNAAPRIVEVLASVDLDRDLVVKRFHAVPVEGA